MNRYNWHKEPAPPYWYTEVEFLDEAHKDIVLDKYKQRGEAGKWWAFSIEKTISVPNKRGARRLYTV